MSQINSPGSISPTADPKAESTSSEIEEEGSELKSFAQRTINELLSLYGYDRVMEQDINRLYTKSKLSNGVAMPDFIKNEGALNHADEIKMKMLEDKHQLFSKITSFPPSMVSLVDPESSHPQRIRVSSENYPVPASPVQARRPSSGYSGTEESVTCVWCRKPGSAAFAVPDGDKSKTFCSEKCFAACRRAEFKRTRVCDGCKQSRKVKEYLDTEGGGRRLQFCSSVCLETYKVSVFCNELEKTQKTKPNTKQKKDNAIASDRDENVPDSALMDLRIQKKIQPKVEDKSQLNNDLSRVDTKNFQHQRPRTAMKCRPSTSNLSLPKAPGTMPCVNWSLPNITSNQILNNSLLLPNHMKLAMERFAGNVGPSTHPGARYPTNIIQPSFHVGTNTKSVHSGTIAKENTATGSYSLPLNSSTFETILQRNANENLDATSFMLGVLASSSHQDISNPSSAQETAEKALHNTSSKISHAATSTNTDESPNTPCVTDCKPGGLKNDSPKNVGDNKGPTWPVLLMPFPVPVPIFLPLPHYNVQTESTNSHENEKTSPAKKRNNHENSLNNVDPRQQDLAPNNAPTTAYKLDSNADADQGAGNSSLQCDKSTEDYPERTCEDSEPQESNGSETETISFTDQAVDLSAKSEQCDRKRSFSSSFKRNLLCENASANDSKKVKTCN
ncbi:uncharacterized protein LOC143465088 [Clavelina lepadiformis]|uniref:uncharacterized protein LOC143465088 n=1 Tax=Clavelina lepadiformis TaxID=159417 RepID=UPI00404170B1